jgi:uncharacterized protein (TIGR02145 family)
MKAVISRVVFVFISFLLLSTYSCKKENDSASPVNETGTMTDIEGNVYKTVKIGSRWWMAENLQVKKYRNGYSIPNVTLAEDWQNAATGAWCVYDPTDVNSAKPGLLYNWFVAADTNNIAPVGWHIPSDDEWKELEKNLGMSAAEADKAGWRGTVEGGKLRIQSPQGWTAYSDIWSANESGFTALAGSCRLFNGEWGQPGLQATGFWWTGTGSADSMATYRYLDYKHADVFRGQCSKKYGMSIRCIKD